MATLVELLSLKGYPFSLIVWIRCSKGALSKLTSLKGSSLLQNVVYKVIINGNSALKELAPFLREVISLKCSSAESKLFLLRRMGTLSGEANLCFYFLHPS